MPESTQSQLQQMVAAYALDAVDHARSLGVNLDFSLDSIKAVEVVLGRMYDERPRGFLAKMFGRVPGPEVIDGFSKMYGGYIGEVLRRLYGGEWALDSATQPGRTLFVLQNQEKKIWPTARVGKRLTNGHEDNVWAYVQIVLTTWKAG